MGPAGLMGDRVRMRSKVKSDESVRIPVQVPREALTFPLREAADRFPNKVAVVEPEAGGREWTYAVLEDRSSALAASLADLGINPGDRVALWMKNSVEYILSFTAYSKPVELWCRRALII